MLNLLKETELIKLGESREGTWSYNGKEWVFYLGMYILNDKNICIQKSKSSLSLHSLVKLATNIQTHWMNSVEYVLFQEECMYV